jgi:hypothetical protein
LPSLADISATDALPRATRGFTRTTGAARPAGFATEIDRYRPAAGNDSHQTYPEYES